MEKRTSLATILCAVIIGILATLLTLSLTGVLDIKGLIDREKDNIVDKNENNDDASSENDIISYRIEEVPMEGASQYKNYHLYVNDKLVPFKFISGSVEVKQMMDILIVEISMGSSTLYAVDKDANIIGVFTASSNSSFTDYNILETKLYYRDTYRIEGNDIYIETDSFANGLPSYMLCNTITNDEDIVIYEEKFTYLGNNKFSDAELVNTISRKQYMQQHNISCNN